MQNIRYFFALLLLPLVSQAVQFEGGNNFTSNIRQGEVHVYCNDNGSHDSNHFYCTEERLSPGEFVGIVTEETIDADEVKLTAEWIDGTIRRKRGDYSTEKKSSETFNLWVSTLFQRPLLSYGTNKISYEFTKDGSTVSSGEFTATVEIGATVQCPYRVMHSNNAIDCRSSGHICSQYFFETAYACR